MCKDSRQSRTCPHLIACIVVWFVCVFPCLCMPYRSCQPKHPLHPAHPTPEYLLAAYKLDQLLLYTTVGTICTMSTFSKDYLPGFVIVHMRMYCAYTAGRALHPPTERKRERERDNTKTPRLPPHPPRHTARRQEKACARQIEKASQAPPNSAPAQKSKS